MCISSHSHQQEEQVNVELFSIVTGSAAAIKRLHFTSTAAKYTVPARGAVMLIPGMTAALLLSGEDGSISMAPPKLTVDAARSAAELLTVITVRIRVDIPVRALAWTSLQQALLGIFATAHHSLPKVMAVTHRKPPAQPRSQPMAQPAALRNAQPEVQQEAEREGKRIGKRARPLKAMGSKKRAVKAKCPQASVCAHKQVCVCIPCETCELQLDKLMDSLVLPEDPQPLDDSDSDSGSDSDGGHAEVHVVLAEHIANADAQDLAGVLDAGVLGEAWLEKLVSDAQNARAAAGAAGGGQQGAAVRLDLDYATVQSWFVCPCKVGAKPRG
ncbi:hypothetical protein QJQ45_007312 [Haematococcus lacustris]|nr:hypothetical protein QJQ45_007312 [Haematococcus lacustris]